MFASGMSHLMLPSGLIYEPQNDQPHGLPYTHKGLGSIPSDGRTGYLLPDPPAAACCPKLAVWLVRICT